MSQTVIDRLQHGLPLDEHDQARAVADVADVASPLDDDDLHLALAVCYELHYRGFDGVDDAREWDLGLLAYRAELEACFEAELLKVVQPPVTIDEPVDQVLRQLVDEDAGASLSSHLLKHGTAEQYRSFLTQRSVYHLREADPHTWAIPRLAGRPKAALVEIQTDEYGGGNVDRMHAALFARSMRALGLDDTYGAHWDVATGATFATVNLMSLFGLHRRLRGAVLGHLAMIEMDSTTPNRRYAAGLRRLGYGRDATEFFDEHVEADAVHEQLAAVDLCGSFVAAEPERAVDVVWGARCARHVDAIATRALLDQWQVGSSAPSTA